MRRKHEQKEWFHFTARWSCWEAGTLGPFHTDAAKLTTPLEMGLDAMCGWHWKTPRGPVALSTCSSVTKWSIC